MHRIVIRRGKPKRRRVPIRGSLSIALFLAAASCVPAAEMRPALSAAPVPLSGAAALSPAQPIAAIPAADYALPAPADTGLAATPFLRHAARPLDAMRSLDCLTAAVYYEAATEPEPGQRAVAQVVLNRVRHPAYPSSVCGVVYQGPMRVDGGCQFSFTCDGSLFRHPSASSWRQARAIAAAALAGSVYAPVGFATHYHADYVFPDWAPKLALVGTIGRHIFYRLPGVAGSRAAFRQAYSGFEPLPVPARTHRPRAVLPAILPVTPKPFIADSLPPARYTDAGLPESTIRPEFANTGRPLAEFR